jgi:hypothetical protein
LTRASAKRCSADGPAYDIDGRFKQVVPAGWRLAPAYVMRENMVLTKCPLYGNYSSLYGLKWCCQYYPDWSGRSGQVLRGGAPRAPGGAGACLSRHELMAAACVAQQGCAAFSGDHLYLRCGGEGAARRREARHQAGT